MPAATDMQPAAYVAEHTPDAAQTSTDVPSRGPVVAVAGPAVSVVTAMIGVVSHARVVATPLGVDHSRGPVRGLGVPNAARRAAMVSPCLGRADREGGRSQKSNYAHGSKSSQHHRISCHLFIWRQSPMPCPKQLFPNT